MKNNQFSKNAISHKELNILLKEAKRKNPSLNTSEHIESKRDEEFNELISNWSETSKRILMVLKNNDEVVTKNRSPKSLIAFGAMSAHLNMALQALKATEFDK